MTNKTKWQNRIVGSDRVDPKTLVPNPDNWRLHPEQQSKAMDDTLKELGWIAQIIVNKTTGRIVDGHMRVALAIQRGETEVPVTYVELSEEDERKALATLDPLGAAAGADAGSYERLAEHFTTDSLWLRELVTRHSDKLGDPDSDDDQTEVTEEDKEIPEMDLQAFEHYDYIVLMFKTDQDFLAACDLLKIQKVKTPIPHGKHKIGLGRVIDGGKAIQRLQGNE